MYVWNAEQSDSENRNLKTKYNLYMWKHSGCFKLYRFSIRRVFRHVVTPYCMGQAHSYEFS